MRPSVGSSRFEETDFLLSSFIEPIIVGISSRLYEVPPPTLRYWDFDSICRFIYLARKVTMLSKNSDRMSGCITFQYLRKIVAVYHMGLHLKSGSSSFGI